MCGKDADCFPSYRSILAGCTYFKSVTSASQLLVKHYRVDQLRAIVIARIGRNDSGALIAGFFVERLAGTVPFGIQHEQCPPGFTRGISAASSNRVATP